MITEKKVAGRMALGDSPFTLSCEGDLGPG